MVMTFQGQRPGEDEWTMIERTLTLLEHIFQLLTAPQQVRRRSGAQNQIVEHRPRIRETAKCQAQLPLLTARTQAARVFEAQNTFHIYLAGLFDELPFPIFSTSKSISQPSKWAEDRK